MGPVRGVASMPGTRFAGQVRGTAKQVGVGHGDLVEQTGRRGAEGRLGLRPASLLLLPLLLLPLVMDLRRDVEGGLAAADAAVALAAEPLLADLHVDRVQRALALI